MASSRNEGAAERPNSDSVLALVKALESTDLPESPIKNAYPRLMAALWRMAADDYLEKNPTAFDEAQWDEPSAIGTIYTLLIMEFHSWDRHGVRAVDFVFPTFFGFSLDQCRVVEEGG